jgi:CheY-like chemotaxis protein
MTILVCEDDLNNRQGFKALLSMLGYAVLAAATGRKAIEICQNKDRPIDLFIADLDLPDLSGTQVALKAAESNPHMPILFVSATPMDGWSRRDLYNFRQLPSALVDFIEKPFRLSALRDKIAELIQRASVAVCFQ